MELEDQVKDMEAIMADTENQQTQFDQMKWVCYFWFLFLNSFIK
jgi:hypothetical protein